MEQKTWDMIPGQPHQEACGHELESKSVSSPEALRFVLILLRARHCVAS